MAERRPFRPEDIFRFKTLSDPQISPDGRRVAFVVTFADREQDAYRAQLYVAPTDGGAPVRWTNGPRKDSQPRWSPDGRYLAFVRELPDEKPQLYLLRADGGEAWKLTSLPNGVSQPVWSPDGRRIAFVSPTGGDPRPEKERSEAEKHQPHVVEHLAHKLDGVGFFDDRRSHLFVVEIAGSDERPPEPRQLTAGDWNDHSPCWSPDGRAIAFLSYRERDRHDLLFAGDVWVVPAEGGAARRVTRSRGPVNQLAWSPDGRWIAYSGHEHGYRDFARTVHLFVVPADGGEPRNLTASLDRPVIGPLVPAANLLAWSPDGRGVRFVAADRGNLTLFEADLEGGVTPLIAGERAVTGFTVSADGGRIAFTAQDTARPNELFLADRSGREERPLTDLNGAFLTEVELPRARRFTYPGADGWPMDGWIIEPTGARAGAPPWPAVLEIHGGPHGHYGNLFYPTHQALAGAGYLVIFLNPRGSMGYGEAFTRACVADWGGKDFEDLMRGVDYAVEQGWADPERLAVTGYSYGGFMTTWVVGQTDRFKAAMAGACVSDQYSMWGTSDIGETFTQFELGGHFPHERPEVYLERSPVHHLHRCTTPLLLLHWEGDLRCPISQSEEVFTMLRALGKEALLVRYPGGFHTYWTHAPSQRADALARTNAWLDRFLRR